MLFRSRRCEPSDIGESGFVLVLSLVVLLMLSLFGAWALQTSTFELKVAGGEQQVENQFNIVEGAAYAEAGKVGFFQKDFYKITNPSLFNQPLIPMTDVLFNPGTDANVPLVANLPVPPTPPALIAYLGSFPDRWPCDNLLRDRNNPSTANAIEYNAFDYRYLVTYRYPSSPPIGYDASMFSGYKFRIQGNAALVVIELGGNKVGVKASL